MTIKYYIQIQNKPGVKRVSADIFLPCKFSERYVNVQGAGVPCELHKLVTMFTMELSWMPLFHFKHTSVRLPYTARLDLTLASKCQTRGLGRSDLSYFPRCPSFIEHFCLQDLQVLTVRWELHFGSNKNKSPAVWLGTCVPFWSPLPDPKQSSVSSFSHWGTGDWHPPHGRFASAPPTPGRASAPSSHPSHRPTDPVICTQRF